MDASERGEDRKKDKLKGLSQKIERWKGGGGIVLNDAVRDVPNTVAA